MEIIKPPYSSVAQALDAASRLVGGRKILADMLGVGVAAIGNWKVRGVPVEHCFAIERATQGEVTRKDLRPDDWQDIWPELANPAATEPPAEPAAAHHIPVDEPGALRTGVIRRHAKRRQQDAGVKAERRDVGPPCQSLETGVA